MRHEQRGLSGLSAPRSRAASGLEATRVRGAVLRTDAVADRHAGIRHGASVVSSPLLSRRQDRPGSLRCMDRRRKAGRLRRGLSKRRPGVLHELHLARSRSAAHQLPHLDPYADQPVLVSQRRQILILYLSHNPPRRSDRGMVYQRKLRSLYPS